MEIPHEFIPVLLVQIALFLGLWVFLKRVWFVPALRIIEAREKRSHGAIAEAKALQEEAERLRREHAAALDQAKSEAQREVQDLLRQAAAAQRKVIGGATEDAQRTIATVRGQIAQEVAVARQKLRGEVQVIAKEVAKAIMGRPV